MKSAPDNIKGEWDQKWEGANLAMAPTLLRRNGGLEDRVTMSKLAAGKRWDVSKHNTAKCVLCEEEFDSVLCDGVHRI